MKTMRGGMSRREFMAASAMAAIGLRQTVLAEGSGGPVVVTRSGKIRGEVMEGVKVFRGIPFAEPPVGALRFRAPAKVKAWEGVRDALSFGPPAMQANGDASEHSEDCLYLNVYAPKGAEKLPVLVWIHGGGFTGGHAGSGEGFAKDGVVCVTVAYRLGMFGFLDVSPLLGDSYAGSANNSVRDLIAAMEWVRDNIAAFGGDPVRVTVGGQSAGAKLTDILLGVPSARGLFTQGISESGGAERVWESVAAAQVASKSFGEMWRSGGKDNAALLKADAGELMAAQEKFLQAWPHRSPLKPEVDGVLLTKMPVVAIVGGSAEGKKLLIGTNREESVAMIGTHPAEVKSREIGSVTPEVFAAVEGRYKALYPELSEERRRIRALTAEEYWVPSVRAADAMVKGGGSVWMYLLTFTEGGGKLAGFAYHSEELPMVWGKAKKDIPNAAAEQTLEQGMHPAWVAFVRGEAPVGPGLPAWPLYRADTRPTMVFDAETKVEIQPQEKELRLWDGAL